MVSCSYVQLWGDVCLLALSEAGPVATADPGKLCVLTSCLTAQPGGVEPVFRHVQLWGTTLSFVGSQLRSPGSTSRATSGPRPPAFEPGLRPGRLLWKRRSAAQATLVAQWPHQVECGGSLWLHQITARSDEDTHYYIWQTVMHHNKILYIRCTIHVPLAQQNEEWMLFILFRSCNGSVISGAGKDRDQIDPICSVHRVLSMSWECSSFVVYLHVWERLDATKLDYFLLMNPARLTGFHLFSAGCQEIADEFRSQEIDGQALLLLKEDHLMSTMNIKLGPALKIFARINMLKDS